MQGESFIMNIQDDFLKFEAVLSYCEDQVLDGSLGAAMEYGRTLGYFNGYNSLSQSGRMLAEVLLSTTKDAS